MAAPRLGTVLLLKSSPITERLSTAVEKARGPIRTLNINNQPNPISSMINQLNEVLISMDCERCIKALVTCGHVVMVHPLALHSNKHLAQVELADISRSHGSLRRRSTGVVEQHQA